MIEPGIIDFHTHAFPDAVAPRAMAALQSDADEVKAYLDGTVSDLLRSMDASGIEKSVICTIATRPGQFEGILQWCDEIRSDRILPLPSVHPDDDNAASKVEQIKREGFDGVKLHPFYQQFYLADENLSDVYGAVSDSGLVLLLHCGFDIAFPRERRADPAGVLALIRKWGRLKLVAAHMGGWDVWDEVEQYLIGEDVYMDLSFTFRSLGCERTAQLIGAHGAEKVLFGTDSPWNDQGREVEMVRSLELPDKQIDAILYQNAARLLAD